MVSLHLRKDLILRGLGKRGFLELVADKSATRIFEFAHTGEDSTRRCRGSEKVREWNEIAGEWRGLWVGRILFERELWSSEQSAQIVKRVGRGCSNWNFRESDGRRGCSGSR